MYAGTRVHSVAFRTRRAAKEARVWLEARRATATVIEDADEDAQVVEFGQE